MERQLSGFTLIELLCTLAILAALAVLVAPTVELGIQRRKEQELRSALREIRNGLDEYKRAYDDGKIKNNLNLSGYPETLNVLVSGVENQRDPMHRKIYFLRRIPADPFSDSGRLTGDFGWGLRSYKSAPDSPEAGDDVFDVFSKSTKIGLNGIQYSKW